MSADGEEASREVSKGERAKATGDLDRVTDYVEEREMDSAAVADSMRAVMSATAAKRAAAQRERASIKIQEADVQLIIDELEVDQRVAERALREARGDVVKALCQLVR